MAEDIFDAVVLLEETQTEEGRQAGLRCSRSHGLLVFMHLRQDQLIQAPGSLRRSCRDGREQGQQQGHDTGYEKGKEIASEVAFYDGCAQARLAAAAEG